MKASIAAIVIFLALGVGGAFLASLGGRVLFPFHTGTLDPWKADAPEWVAAEPRNYNVGDKHTIIHPDLVYTLERRKLGESLDWNPRNFAGLPHAANPLTAVFYPPNLLFRFGDPLRMYAIVAALHLFLAAAFMFLFLRSIGLGAPAAFLGGMGFAMSGWVTVHIHHAYFLHAFVWLPLGLLGIEKVLAGGGRRWGTVFAAALAMSILAGFPQTAVINTYVWAIWGAVGVMSAKETWRMRSHRLGRLAIFALLGLALSAIQWLPTLDYVREAGHHGQTIEDLRSDTLRPAALLGLICPDLLGNPSIMKGPTDDFFSAWLLADGRFGAPTTNNYSERSFFPGTFVLAMALLFPFFRRRRPEIVASVTALIGVLAAIDFRIGPFSVLAAVIRAPGLGFGSPMRLTQIAAFAWPMLGAVTIDGLLEAARRGSFRTVVIGSLGAAGIVAPAAVAVFALWLAPSYSTTLFVKWLESRGVDRLMGVGAMPTADKVANFLAIDPATGVSTLGFQRVNLTILFAGMAAVFFFIVAAGRGTRRSILISVAALAIFFELGWFMARFNRPVVREGLYETRADGIDYLRAHQGDARFIRFGLSDDMSFFIPNASQIYGLNDAQGFRALAPRRYLDFMRTVEANPVDIGLPNLKKTESLRRPALDLLRVKHVVSAAPIPDPPWKAVFPADPKTPSAMWIYENPNVLPRAFVAPAARSFDSESAVLEAIRTAPPAAPGAPHPFRSTIYVDRPVDTPRASIRTKDVMTILPKVLSDRPGEIEIDLGGEFAGWLVVSEGWSPNWKVRVVKVGADIETRAPIPADHSFMATPVDAGTYRVTFVYAPAAANLGFSITAVATIAAIGVFMRWNWNRRASRSQRTARTMTGETKE